MLLANKKFIMIRKKRNRPQQKNALVYVPTLVCLCLVGVFLSFTSKFNKNWNYNWHGVHLELREKVKYLEERDWAVESNNKEKFKVLVDARTYIIDSTSTTELEILSNYPNGVIRTLAYKGLLKQNIPNKIDWIERAINDTCYIVIIPQECRDHFATISEMLFDYYIYNPELTEENRIQNFQAMYGLTRKETEEIFALYKEREGKRYEYIEKYRGY